MLRCALSRPKRCLRSRWPQNRLSALKEARGHSGFATGRKPDHTTAIGRKILTGNRLAEQIDGLQNLYSPVRLRSAPPTSFWASPSCLTISAWFIKPRVIPLRRENAPSGTGRFSAPGKQERPGEGSREHRRRTNGAGGSASLPPTLRGVTGRVGRILDGLPTQATTSQSCTNCRKIFLALSRDLNDPSPSGKRTAIKVPPPML